MPNDELYLYDGLNRLGDMQRGLLNSTKTAIQSGTLGVEEEWSLDAVGNGWQIARDVYSGGLPAIQQQRSFNTVNEITAILPATNPTPTYDAAGNTTSFFQPDDLTQSFQGVYDAWNRLVRVMDGDDQRIVKYVYDARGYRIQQRVYNDSNRFTAILDHYYSNQWQVLETRKSADAMGADGQVLEQNVWGQSAGSYVDELVLRDRDTNGDGTLDERFYVNQDANYTVTAILDTAGIVQERYAPSPYGTPEYLAGDWSSRSTSSYAWVRIHQGGEYNPTTGLYDFRNRMFSPVLGAWLQRDPLGYDDGMNLYEYIKSTPQLLVDPFGLGLTTLPVSQPSSPPTTQPVPPTTQPLPPEYDRKQYQALRCHCAIGPYKFPDAKQFPCNGPADIGRKARWNAKGPRCDFASNNCSSLPCSATIYYECQAQEAPFPPDWVIVGADDECGPKEFTCTIPKILIA